MYRDRNQTSARTIIDDNFSASGRPGCPRARVHAGRDDDLQFFFLWGKNIVRTDARRQTVLFYLFFSPRRYKRFDGRRGGPASGVPRVTDQRARRHTECIFCTRRTLGRELQASSFGDAGRRDVFGKRYFSSKRQVPRNRSFVESEKKII